MPYVVSSNPVGPNTGLDWASYLSALSGQYAASQAGQGMSPFGYAPWSQSSQGVGDASANTSPYDVPGQYLNAYNEAKNANEQRYQSILGGYQDRLNSLMQNQIGAQDDILTGYENRYQRGMTNLQGLGTQEKADTNQRYDQMQAQNRQDLVSRGLTGSTILPTMRQGVERERADALSRVNERLQREALGYDAQLSGDALAAQAQQYGLTNNLYGTSSGDLLGFAERRSDSYPDFNQLASLAQAYGQGGGSGYMAGVPQGVDLASFGYQLPGMQNGQLQFGAGMGGGFNFVQPWWFGNRDAAGAGVPMEFNGVGNSSTGSLPVTRGLPIGSTMSGAAVDTSAPEIDPTLVAKYGPVTSEMLNAMYAYWGRYPDSPKETQDMIEILQSNGVMVA